MNGTAVDKLSVTLRTYMYDRRARLMRYFWLSITINQVRTVNLSQLMKNSRHCVFKWDKTPVWSVSVEGKLGWKSKNCKCMCSIFLSGWWNLWSIFLTRNTLQSEKTVRCQNIWKIYNACESTLMMFIKCLYTNKMLKIDPMLVGRNGQEPSPSPFLL